MHIPTAMVIIMIILDKFCSEVYIEFGELEEKLFGNIKFCVSIFCEICVGEFLQISIGIKPAQEILSHNFLVRCKWRDHSNSL